MLPRLALALVALLLGVSGADAQEATPPAATPAATTDPASCTVEPRPLSFLDTLVRLPDPETTPVPITGVPEGEPVDEATRGEVANTVTMLIACVNGGELLRAFALYEDAYLRRVIDPEAVMTTEIANEIVVSFATPEPVSADSQTELVGLPLMRLLGDGRVVVVLETNGGVDDEDDQTRLDLLILTRVDGRWLIVDGRTDLPRDELPPA